jgi:hypothetical protein
MPWKIIEADYDPNDDRTLHDDELIAIERALNAALGSPQNETNPTWRAHQKVLPLARRCSGDGDPIRLLPPEARRSPVWAAYPRDPRAAPPPATPAADESGDPALPDA